MTGATIHAIRQLRQIGQSIWLDNLTRSMLEGGDLERLVGAGEVTGVTTNPSIFRSAIANGAAYRADLERLKARGSRSGAAL